MKKTFLLVMLALSTTHVYANDWAYSFAKDIHPSVKVHKFETEQECQEVSRQLKGYDVYVYGEENRYGDRPFFSGKLNSKGEYVMTKCARKVSTGSWAFVAPKNVIDNLLAKQQERQQAAKQRLQEKAKSSGLL